MISGMLAIFIRMRGLIKTLEKRLPGPDYEYHIYKI